MGTALELGKLSLEAGIPEGVINIVQGLGPGAGAALASHPDVNKIAFTGSTGTAKHIINAAGIKPVTTELGGKSPAIVFPDADIKMAADTVHMGLFLNHGQCCCASSRVFVHESIYDEFVELSVQKANKRRVGDPFGDVDQGPQVDQIKFDKGFYVEPTIFVDVPDTAIIQREEIFGPVMGIAKWSEEAEVIRRANDSNYGLAAGIFTSNLSTAMRVQRHLKAGTVWINTYNLFDNATPFGGYKESGVGREKGKDALNNYLLTKTVTMPQVGDPCWSR